MPKHHITSNVKTPLKKLSKVLSKEYQNMQNHENVKKKPIVTLNVKTPKIK